MKYLPSLIKQDIKFQFRHGFYLVYGIISGLYIVLLKVLGPKVSSVLSPIILFTDPTFIGFFFIGAILFFEREQRVTEALFVTPITKSGYILSKCISLTLISLLVVILISIVIHGLYINWFLLLFAVTSTSFIFILIGIIFSKYFKTVTIYLILGGLALGPFSLPIIYQLGLVNSKLFYLLPTTASLKLISGSINGGLTPVDTIFSITYLTILTIIMFNITLKLKGADSEDI